MHKLDLEAARGTSGLSFPSVCLLLKVAERGGQKVWIQGPNPSRLCAHTHISILYPCNLHGTPQDKALKLWVCIIRHVNNVTGTLKVVSSRHKSCGLWLPQSWATSALQAVAVLLKACLHALVLPFRIEIWGSLGFNCGGDEKVEAEREFIFSFNFSISCEKAIGVSSFPASSLVSSSYRNSGAASPPVPLNHMDKGTNRIMSNLNKLTLIQFLISSEWLERGGNRHETRYFH